MEAAVRLTVPDVPASSPVRYRLRAAPVPVFAFGNEVAAFNPATWDTHLLHRSATTVIDLLAHGPAPRDAIEAAVEAAYGAPDLACALVDELVAAELIEAEPVDAPG